jgi:alkanesulfonate monooxygenase SsuD/methylene tetrahydromethanopterin reductase-like flavin-dependent oxidoreductase (luciferase family)
VLLPPPDRPIPILVAGNRPRMLRLTARYADAWNTAWYELPDKLLGQRLAEMHAALRAESRDPATLRRTVGMDWELTDPGQTGRGSFTRTADELARAIDAYERLGIDDLIIRLQPSTQPALDGLARAVEIRGH